MAIKIRDGGAWVDVGGGGSGSGSGPIGSIIYYPSSSPPDGYLKANGASLNTSTYSDLFSVFGYTFGGSGSSFNLPDLRGEFIRGWDDGRGADLNQTYTADGGGSNINVTVSSSTRSIGSSQSWSVQNMTGRAVRFNYNLAVISPTPSVFGVWNSSGSERTDGGGNNAYGLSFNSARQVNSSNETRPRNVALLACIKYQ